MKPTLTEAEAKLSYAKYFHMPLTPIPQEKLDILAAGPMDPEKMLKITDRVKLFDQGYFDVEVGYGVQEDGSGYVSNLTKMPGVTKEMFEWWFAWHGLEDLRYKIWDPEDHYYARQKNRDKALSSNLPMRERTWGTTHEVLEDIGPGPDELILDFKYPSEMGYPEEKVGTDACASMMCANGHGPEPGKGVAAVMTHMIREIEGGIELRSRFWIGYQIMDGRPMKLIPKGVSVPMEVPMGLFAHNLKEFTHLAAILPKVYEEEKDRF